MTDPRGIYLLATLLGALGMWLLLPRGQASGRMTGAALAAAALGLAASQLPSLGEWFADGLFWILGGVTLTAAAAAVTFRNPVYCAIWFGMTLLGVAGVFLLLDAQFLAVATVVIYAGAILVTFLFVIMLAQPEGRAAYDRVSWEAMVSAAVGVVIIGILTTTIASVLQTPGVSVRATEEAMANGVLAPEHVVRLGGELFGRHLVAVEVAAVLLLAALVGAAAIVGRVGREEDGS